MADILPQNIINGLPALQWRGLDAPPYDIAPIEVSHTQAERRFPYIDGAGHDHTGRNPVKFTVRLYFINTLALEASTRLFPDLWEQWRAALLDGSAGDFRHPLLGPLRARVVSWNAELDANKSLAGVMVNVNWTETLDDPSQASDFQPLENNITALAVAADSALEAIGPVAQFEEGPPLADLLQQAEGFAFSTSLTVGGVLNQAKGVVGQTIDTLDAVDSAVVFAARDIHVQLYSAILDASEKLGAGTSRGTGFREFPFSTTVSAVATATGNVVADIMTLNRDLLGSPVIPAGTSVKFYTE